jgi:hypothetical protein
MLIAIGFVAALACVLIFSALKVGFDDQQLDRALVAIHEEAKSKLSSDTLAQLQLQLDETVETCRTMVKQGVRPQVASRMGKRASIQSIAQFLELERLLPDPS